MIAANTVIKKYRNFLWIIKCIANKHKEIATVCLTKKINPTEVQNRTSSDKIGPIEYFFIIL
jgi:hypothetical protein